MAEFKVQIKCMWNSETGEFENCAGEESMQDNEEEEDDDDDDAEWNMHPFLSRVGEPSAGWGHPDRDPDALLPPESV